jgi:hypothetical protein
MNSVVKSVVKFTTDFIYTSHTICCYVYEVSSKVNSSKVSSTVSSPLLYPLISKRSDTTDKKSRKDLFDFFCPHDRYYLLLYLCIYVMHIYIYIKICTYIYYIYIYMIYVLTSTVFVHTSETICCYIYVYIYICMYMYIIYYMF